MKSNNQIIYKAALLLVRYRKVLFVRTRGVTLYYTVGGKIHEGETEIEALAREIPEELGVEVVLETVTYLQSFQAQADGKPEGTMVNLACYAADIIGEPSPCSEIVELDWFTSEERSRTTTTGQMVLDWLKASDLID